MFRSPFPDVDIPDVTVYDYLFASLTDEDADRVALVDGPSGRETTFRELRAQVDAVAGALAARGIGVGDVVGLLCPNVPAFVAVFHGILRAGATVTTVNSLYTAREVASQLRSSGARMLFTVTPLLAAGGAAADEIGLGADDVVVLDGAEGHPSLRDLLTVGTPAPDVHVDPSTHVAVLPYSSGTTGVAKGVLLTHRNLVANVAQTSPLLEMTPEDRVLAVLPFFHIYGLTVLLNLALVKRARLVTMPRFDLQQFLQLVQDQGCTYLFIAPPIAVALAKHPMVAEYDLRTVHTVLSGAAPLDAALGQAVAERLGCRVKQGYGMTEMSPVSHVIPASADLPLDSVGWTIPNTECRLVDPATGQDIDVPAEGESEAGELWVRGPQVMVGYLDNAQATADTLDDDGFLHTGDMATVRADGVVTIVDRLKELIKYHGYQVAPAELEALLLTHDDVADSAVIGIRDEEGEEVPKAYVVLQPGRAVSGDEIIAWVAERVAPHKKVRRVEIVEAIPKSSSGKILRRDLRAREAGRL
ncbi:AMP-binding protein [Luteimicrobium subarcticum]|uniref:Acyl-CoA synthetase (AMP-forming)/AMP-acid ligase II n=1 Tax=Luteimicrobium subarcticum TaxID=620910 RepID=A0A2M8W6M4_9MICO|nr:AMP-binding protein [Luteimicrobium subarcticum]PJI86559.1 acyl-CoA synthetase (AMP-forming)/AMP-acid ligase II [Luteimicrobium subarcticum]